MLTISYVDVTVTDHALATGSAPSNYGRTWELTFTNGRANALTLSPFTGQYRSLLVTTGYGFTGSLVVSAAGGTLMGSSNQVGVERVGTGGVPLYADITGLPASSSPGVPAAYVARVSAANAYLLAQAPVTANVAAYPKVHTTTHTAC